MPKSTSRKTASSNRVSNDDVYTSWNNKVIECLSDEENKLFKKSFVCLYKKLFIVIDGDRTNWTSENASFGKNKYYKLFDIGRNDFKFFNSYIKKTRTSNMSLRYVATDVRGVSAFMTDPTNPIWVKGTPELVLEANNKLDEKKMAKSIADTMYQLYDKQITKPSATFVTQLGKWLKSVHSIMGEGDIANVRFAFEDTTRRASRKSRPVHTNMRRVVKATDVDAELGGYYIHNRRENTTKKLTKAEMKDLYLAVNVDKTQHIASTHVSPNESKNVIDYMCLKQPNSKEKTTTQKKKTTTQKKKATQKK